MSPPIKAISTTHLVGESDSREVRSASWINVREPSAESLQSCRGFVAELALRLSEVTTLDAALQLVSKALRDYLPDCRVDFHGSEQDQPIADTSAADLAAPASGSCQSSTQLLGYCEWSLAENDDTSPDSDALLLSITLPSSRQARDVAAVLEVGEQVASLLRAVVRFERLRQTLVNRTDELLELRRRIIQAEKLASYGQLVASTLHDLNNPLTAIVAYSEYLAQSLAKKGLDSEDIARLARMRDAAQVVLRQTRRLVEYACPPRTPLSSVDLAEVVQRALALCEHELTRAQLEVQTQIQDDLPNVQGHAEHLTQMFVNLFTNAAQAARPENGWLRVTVCVEQSATSTPARLNVCVSDNGTGIAPADIEHVFEAFYTTKTGTGCGLGLAIVRDIVEHHAGRISVTSTPLVETTFRLVLRTEATTSSSRDCCRSSR